MSIAHLIVKKGRAMSRSRLVAGFTLVELLVVIAVIALLMSLLLPGLRNAKDRVRITVCATRLDQMHTALHAALIDRPGGILPTCDWGQTVVSPVPSAGYLGDTLGMFGHELDDYGWTYQVSLCPGITPDTGGDARRGFWYTRRPDGGGFGGSDYLYTGGRSNHPGNSSGTPDSLRKAFAPPRYGFAFGKPGGIYYSVDGIYSGTLTVDANGLNPFRDETYPSEVIYLGDIAYNAVDSYPGWYYGATGYVDPSNHRDTVVADHKYGKDRWPAVGRGSNRMKADGSVEWWNFPVKNRGKGGKMGGAYLGDYYTAYY